MYCNATEIEIRNCVAVNLRSEEECNKSQSPLGSGFYAVLTCHPHNFRTTCVPVSLARPKSRTISNHLLLPSSQLEVTRSAEPAECRAYHRMLVSHLR
jgi:hypothetical protein